MTAVDADQIERRRILADKLGFLLDEDVQLLFGVKASTTEAWRKRGSGPPHVMCGNSPLYPLPGVQKFMASRERDRERGLQPRSLL